jgi:hypothetical protein
MKGLSRCYVCNDAINWYENGGHIYVDGTTICSDCLEIE